MPGNADPPAMHADEGSHHHPHPGRVRETLSSLTVRLVQCCAGLRTVEPGLFLLHGGLPSPLMKQADLTGTPTSPRTDND